MSAWRAVNASFLYDSRKCTLVNDKLIVSDFSNVCSGCVDCSCDSCGWCLFILFELFGDKELSLALQLDKYSAELEGDDDGV